MMIGSTWRRTPVALLNLTSQPTRTIACVLGVSFALLLIFMQLGFRGAVGNTANIVYSKFAGELIMRSPDYVHLYEPRTFERSWMRLAEGHPMVERIDPFYIMLQRWQNPPRNPGCVDAPPDGSFRTVGMMAMEVDRPVLDLPEILSQLDKIKDPDALLVDRATRAEYGPWNCREFSDEDIEKGHSVDLGGRTTRIAGHFRLGTGLATNGAVLISDVAFQRRSGLDVRRRASLGLIHLKPGVDPDIAKNDLVRWLNDRDSHALESVQVLTLNEQRLWERKRWLNETPIGMIFTMGVVLSFIIGSAIVYMILANDVSNRLPEYATLKAMGYSPFFVARIVVMQSLFLAGFSYFPAMAASLVLYEITAMLSNIPTYMTWERAIGVFVLAVLMCSIAGLLAVIKLWKAEPASLF